jgi:hypothetical protein
MFASFFSSKAVFTLHNKWHPFIFNPCEYLKTMNAHLRLHNIFRSQQYCLNSSLFHNGPHHPLQRSRQCPPRCRSQQREVRATPVSPTQLLWWLAERSDSSKHPHAAQFVGAAFAAGKLPTKCHLLNLLNALCFNAPCRRRPLLRQPSRRPRRSALTAPQESALPLGTT